MPAIAPPDEYDTLTDAERRARRREIIESLTFTESPVERSIGIAGGSVLHGARDLIASFERGDDDLHGMPRHVVDFPRVMALLDDAINAATEV